MLQLFQFLKGGNKKKMIQKYFWKSLKRMVIPYNSSPCIYALAGVELYNPLCAEFNY